MYYRKKLKGKVIRSRFLASQSTNDCGGILLLFARPAVTLPALRHQY